MSTNAIEIRELVKRFKRFQLGPLNLTVPQGAIYGLIGPNGAGKTTTLDLVMSLGREDEGRIRVFELDPVAQEVEVKRRIGYVSPDLSFAAWRKVNRLVHFMRGFYPDWDDEYCRRLLTKLNLGWEDKIGALSFGAKVKLGLVMALSHKPDLLLLDEPTIGVDAVSKKQIYSELLAAVQNEERTVVIASHSLADIERFADHVGMIKNGKLILEGPTSDMVDPFRMLDFVYANGSEPKAKGLYIQEQSGDRWRALIDTRRGAREQLQAMGAREISETPVTLEELFIALTISPEG